MRRLRHSERSPPARRPRQGFGAFRKLALLVEIPAPVPPPRALLVEIPAPVPPPRELRAVASRRDAPSTCARALGWCWRRGRYASRHAAGWWSPLWSASRWSGSHVQTARAAGRSAGGSPAVARAHPLAAAAQRTRSRCTGSVQSPVRTRVSYNPRKRCVAAADQRRPPS